MNEDKKLQIATFRFGIIGDFVTGARLDYGDRERLLKDKSIRRYQIPFSNRTVIARNTIEKWICDYKKAGFRLEGLYPKIRVDKGKNRFLSTEIKLNILELKKQNPELTVPALIKLLKYKKLLTEGQRLNHSTIYQFLKREKIEKVNLEAKDKRKFEALHPNQIWQSDVMHGPYVDVNGKKKKVYLIAIIDDFSRMIIGADFYLSETRESFIHCLQEAVMARGLPQKLYIDNGSCFRALHLEQIAAQLGIAIHHSRPYTPQGRGKIERWFKHVRDNFLLPYTDKKLDLKSLKEDFEQWVLEYNHRLHSSTNEKPIERYKNNLQAVRPAPHDITKYFRQIEWRRVRKDRTVKLNNLSYEVPVNLIDRKIELRFFPDDPNSVEIYFDNKSHGFAKIVDLHVNSTIGRNWEPLPLKKDPILIEQKVETGLLKFNEDL